MVLLGSGTPLPMREAKHLVVQGPYRWVRNPMAIAGIGQGLAVALGQGQFLYMIVAAGGAILWHVLIRPVEEAHLAARFGSAYDDYRSRVQCWWIQRR